MADAADPRALQLTITSCDDCPLRQYMESDEHVDAGWSCGHPAGGFWIADIGSHGTAIRCRDSVVARLGRAFPDLCPLPVTEPDEAGRTRSIELDQNQ